MADGLGPRAASAGRFAGDRRRAGCDRSARAACHGRAEPVFPAVGRVAGLRTFNAGPGTLGAAQPRPCALHARDAVRAAARPAADRLGGYPWKGIGRLHGVPGVAGTDRDVVRAVGGSGRACSPDKRCLAAEVRSPLNADRDVPVPAVLNQMCDEGRLLRDRPLAGGVTPATPTAFSQKHFPTCSSTAAIRPGDQAADRALHRAVRPVTLEDITWWTGLSVGRCRTALAELEDRITPVRVPGWDGDHLVLRADLDRMAQAAAPRRRSCRFLPALTLTRWAFADAPGCWTPSVMRSSMTGGGNATSVVLVDGRVAGVWDAGPSPTFFPFVDLPPCREGATLLYFRSGPWLSQMTPLTERKEDGS